MSNTNIYDSYTINSPSLIKRFTHQVRYKTSVDLILKNAKRILDYGTGSGRVLGLIAPLMPDTEIFGYEPFIEFVNQAKTLNEKNKNVKIVSDLGDLNDKKFETISCFEVFEHLTEELQLKIIEDVKMLLEPTGRFIVSVPIETGISSVLKNFTRWIIGAPHSRNFRDILKAAFNKPIKRNFKAGWVGSHVGFKTTDLEKLFVENGLEIENIVYSPINILKSICNSQKFYILRINTM